MKRDFISVVLVIPIVVSLAMLAAMLVSAQGTPAPQPSIGAIALPASYYGAAAARTTTGSYQIYPAFTSFRSLRVYRNGLRMAPGVDYTTANGVIVPRHPWGIDDLILCDFER